MKAPNLLLLVAPIPVAIDALTRAWVQAALAPHDPVPVVGQALRLTLGYNAGVAFGVFSGGSGPAVLVLTGAIIVGMAAWLLASMREDRLPRQVSWPLGLILGGAVANFVDRLPDGRVTDFVDLGIGASRWPSFNLADSAITLGVAILIWNSFRQQPHTEVIR